jgi:hypothetical protein
MISHIAALSPIACTRTGFFDLPTEATPHLDDKTSICGSTRRIAAVAGKNRVANNPLSMQYDFPSSSHQWAYFSLGTALRG